MGSIRFVLIFSFVLVVNVKRSKRYGFPSLYLNVGPPGNIMCD